MTLPAQFADPSVAWPHQGRRCDRTVGGWRCHGWSEVDPPLGYARDLCNMHRRLERDPAADRWWIWLGPGQYSGPHPLADVCRVSSPRIGLDTGREG